MDARDDNYWGESIDYHYRDDDYADHEGGETCSQCRGKTTAPYWCQPCNSIRFKEEFNNWTSGNYEIDEFVKETQLKATNNYEILEWIPYSNFEGVTSIGRGGFGIVCSAEWTDGNILYWDVKNKQWKRKGIMKVALKYLEDSPNISNEFLNELRNLYNCNGSASHVTRCYGITRHDETYMIVMKIIEYGNIRNNLPKLYEMTWEDKLMSLFRISEGLHQLHKNKLVHRDFHPGNILLSSDNLLYISDLSASQSIDEYTSNEAKDRKVYGVLPYIAPEVLRGDEYTEKADVYSFGIVMSEILSGTPPFSKVPHDTELAIKICNGFRPEIPSNVPPLIIDLMKKCWHVEPLERLSSYELSSIFKVWRYYKNWPNSELARQIKESENTLSNSLTRKATYPSPSAIYTSRFLGFENLPESKNPGHIDDSKLYDLKID